MSKIITLSPKNILIRMPNWLGDLVMAAPVLEALRTHFPDSELTVMCQSNLAELLQEDPSVNHFLIFKKTSIWLRSTGEEDIIEKIREGKYDLGILLTNSFSSAYWFWRGRVKKRLGFKGNLRNLLLTDSVPFPRTKDTMHQVILYQELLSCLGIQNRGLGPKLYLEEEEKKSAAKQLKSLGVEKDSIVIGINPGAAYGSAKCWLPDRFRKLTEKLIQNSRVRVVYFGDKAGASVVNKVCSGLGSQVVNLAASTSIRSLMALMSCCQVFLSNDSGPMHMASALGLPMVALFGSTSDVRTGPFKKAKVIHKRVSCSPCYKRTCPIDFRCMTRIHVDEVHLEIQKYIDEVNLEDTKKPV